MAEAVISPLLDVLIGGLASTLKEEVGLIHGVHEELENLSSMLSMIQCMLADAEERKITDRAVRKWLAELKDVAYDADDVLDEFAYEALRQKLMEPDETKKQVCNFFLTCCLLSPIRFRRNVAHRIKEINKRVRRISRDGDTFRLKKGDGEIKRSPDIDHLPVSSSVIKKNSQFDFIGRDNDKKQIMRLLVSDEHASDGGKHVSVISIVGMGGLGKTTLAQLIYNDENVQKHFQVKAWVCVSVDFDISRLTREIIESAARKNCSSSSIDPMQRELEQILSGKRFLIVLDDVWNTERSSWERLQPPFSVGAKGSKIIVTTRDDAVSEAMNTDHPYRLKHLGDEDCLSLFLQQAFVGESWQAHPELMKIGKDLVEKHCQGLPLAAKALGGLLSSNRDINFWRRILFNQLWSSMEGEDEVMRALGVSYQHLPPHIKQCFSFCSIFPKDYEFEKDELVKLWMAQGFIQPKQSMMMSLEETGSAYFDFLLSRSFFQVEDDCYKMHDCIHDLAMLVSSDECVRFEHGKPTHSPERGHRHSSFIKGVDLTTEDFCHLYQCKGLRTFFVEDMGWTKPIILNQVVSDLTVNLRCLRSLVLSFSNIIELPGSISNLKHLRYLGLSGTNIVQLPKSMSSFYNLQTLDVSYCNSLRQLPKETRKLVHLRHLKLNGCWSLEIVPSEIGRLTCLQTLTLDRFIVGREKGCGIGELKWLKALKGHITIEKMDNVSNAKEAEEANLKDKEYIEGLYLVWDYSTKMQHDRASIEELEKILEAFQPHTNIKRLSIQGYRGKKIPSWLQGMMVPNLESFDILHCENCNSIPPLGQFRMLRHLWIEDIPGVKCIGREFYGNEEIKGFPSLKELTIIAMPNLEEWCEPDESEFPSLQDLVIYDCPKLTEMPNKFSTLKKLALRGCHQLACLPKSPSLEELELWDCNEILLRWVPHLTSLSSLTIQDFKELKSLSEDMLQPLGKLTRLEIWGCEKLVSLVEEEKGLHPILGPLYIFSCPNIMSSPKGLRSLTSLEYLAIGDCPRLLSLPKEGFPTSLQNLDIFICPILSERCRKGDGEDWAKISHIPSIKIDGKLIS